MLLNYSPKNVLELGNLQKELLDLIFKKKQSYYELKNNLKNNLDINKVNQEYQLEKYIYPMYQNINTLLSWPDYYYVTDNTKSREGIKFNDFVKIFLRMLVTELHVKPSLYDLYSITIHGDEDLISLYLDANNNITLNDAQKFIIVDASRKTMLEHIFNYMIYDYNFYKNKSSKEYDNYHQTIVKHDYNKVNKKYILMMKMLVNNGLNLDKTECREFVKWILDTKDTLIHEDNIFKYKPAVLEIAKYIEKRFPQKSSESMSPRTLGLADQARSIIFGHFSNNPHKYGISSRDIMSAVNYDKKREGVDYRHVDTEKVKNIFAERTLELNNAYNNITWSFDGKYMIPTNRYRSDNFNEISIYKYSSNIKNMNKLDLNFPFGNKFSTIFVSMSPNNKYTILSGEFDDDEDDENTEQEMPLMYVKQDGILFKNSNQMQLHRLNIDIFPHKVLWNPKGKYVAVLKEKNDIIDHQNEHEGLPPDTAILRIYQVVDHISWVLIKEFDDFLCTDRPKGRYIEQPVDWSPDGVFLAYCANAHNQINIFNINTLSLSKSIIIDDFQIPTCNVQVALKWSPNIYNNNSYKLAYMSNYKGFLCILSSDNNWSNLPVILEDYSTVQNTFTNIDFVWSQNGKHIAYSRINTNIISIASYKNSWQDPLDLKHKVKNPVSIFWTPDNKYFGIVESNDIKKYILHFFPTTILAGIQHGGKIKYKYNGRLYIVHTGLRKGKYILVGKDKKKIYISK